MIRETGKKHVVVCVALVGLLSSGVSQAFTDSSGREWRQLTETVGLSWSEVATVCPSGGGLCAGSVGGINFSGWTWATASEVTSLYTDSFGIPLNIDRYAAEINSSWAPSFVSTFGVTATASGIDNIVVLESIGYSADALSNPDYGPIPYIFDYVGNAPDIAEIQAATNSHQVLSTVGVYLYHPVTSVPEPEIYAMLGLGLGLLGWVGRRRKLQAA